MNKIAKKLMLMLVLIAGMQFCVNAQPGDPGDDPDIPIPLDPGSWILVAAGVGYGVKKWRDSKQMPRKETQDKF